MRRGRTAYNVGDGGAKDVDNFGAEIGFCAVKEDFGAFVDDDEGEVIDGSDLTFVDSGEMVSYRSVHG